MQDLHIWKWWNLRGGGGCGGCGGCGDNGVNEGWWVIV